MNTINKEKAKLLILLSLGVAAILFLNLYKFSLANQVGFSISHEHIFINPKSEYATDLILTPDEITYATWLIFRADRANDIIENRNLFANTNLYGYLIGFSYLAADGNYKYLFLFGLAGYLLLFVSSYTLLKAIGFEHKTVLIGTGLFMLSPNVLMLGSGFLRDLFVIAFVNYCIIALIQRRYLLLIFSILMLLFTRNFYLVILLPIFLYFLSRSRKGSLDIGLIFLIPMVVLIFITLYLALLSRASGVSIFDLKFLLRFIELQTGVNMVLIRIPYLFSGFYNLMLETISHFYYFVIMMMALTIVVVTLRMKKFYVFLIAFNILLSFLYASYLGFFMSRTKLIVLWFSIIFILYHVNSYNMKRANKINLANH
ncbi:hypothetical protein FM042_04990 [Aliidiomarina halalkaliphila]|uniref:Glycosyltransferase RgtA/B/C/D-like domain-containing protein n=1 Tax=Aliidiomarina halalkaliphila TaxID=2593535 RepID=A0A552X6K9_9GAMM|nr:hypothetical protein [Aliidiomarina halalkaliphila]TRW50193.1 hypothetical protein FM042_04990 [Aliidiomarina halalkaliphila]